MAGHAQTAISVRLVQISGCFFDYKHRREQLGTSPAI